MSGKNKNNWYFFARRENFHTTQLFQSFENVISWRFPALLDIFPISDLENYGTNCSIAMRAPWPYFSLALYPIDNKSCNIYPPFYLYGWFPFAGFHEAIGDTMSLAVNTPAHLRKVGLLEKEPESRSAGMPAMEVFV